MKCRLPDTPGTEIYIGSAEGCHVPLPPVEGAPGVACGIYFDGAQYYIIDREATGAVLCNGQAVENAILKLGETYTAGIATIVYDPEIPVEAPSVQTSVHETQTKPGSGVRKKKRPAGPAGPTVSATRLTGNVPKYQIKKTSPVVQLFTTVYVIVMLALAFWGGMILRYWNETGEIFLPWIDPPPASASPSSPQSSTAG